jgi:hypothetical protein
MFSPPLPMSAAIIDPGFLSGAQAAANETVHVVALSASPPMAPAAASTASGRPVSTTAPDPCRSTSTRTPCSASMRCAACRAATDPADESCKVCSTARVMFSSLAAHRAHPSADPVMVATIGVTVRRPRSMLTRHSSSSRRRFDPPLPTTRGTLLSGTITKDSTRAPGEQPSFRATSH